MITISKDKAPCNSCHGRNDNRKILFRHTNELGIVSPSGIFIVLCKECTAELATKLSEDLKEE